MVYLTPSAATLTLRAITLNAQGLGGKHALLEAQFREKQANVVFIQEAKDKYGVCHTKHFLKLNTDAARHFGISIWISRGLGIFSASDKAALVHEADVRIVYEAPRLLVIEVDMSGIKIALFGAHCPHSGQRTEAAAFQKMYEAKQALKLRTRHRELLWSVLLERGFDQWRTGIDHSAGLLLERHGLLYQLTAAAIKLVTGRIKHCIRTVKAEYLSNLVYKQGDKAVRCAQSDEKGRAWWHSPSSPVATKANLILMSNGEEAGTRQDRDQVWLEQFGEQEHGKVIKIDELIHAPIAPLIIDEQLEWECCHLPSLGKSNMFSDKRRAGEPRGLDAIPGEILRASPGIMSTMSTATAAVAGGGGSCMRLSNVQEATEILPRIALCMLHLRRRCLCADSEDLDEMMQMARQGGMFADGGFPATIRHATKDIHYNTWFATPYTSGDVICRSQAGSRPGESWSDVVYSFVYTRVLARGEQLLPELTYDPDLGPFAAEGQGVPVTGQDATWADDSAWPVIGPQPRELLRKASRLASLVLSQCMSHGMKPNLGRNKTALLYGLRGNGACKAAAEYFHHGKSPLCMGSRGWRKNATALFHPAVPTRTHSTLEPRDDGTTDDVPKQAHRAVCDALLSEELPSAANAVILHLKRTIDGYPLYADEIYELLTIVAGEVREVQAELLAEYSP
eukprot:s6463_g3.t1